MSRGEWREANETGNGFRFGAGFWGRTVRARHKGNRAAEIETVFCSLCAFRSKYRSALIWNFTGERLKIRFDQSFITIYWWMRWTFISIKNRSTTTFQLENSNAIDAAKCPLSEKIVFAAFQMHSRFGRPSRSAQSKWRAINMFKYWLLRHRRDHFLHISFSFRWNNN